MRNNENNIILSLENIIPFSRNITGHFTGKAKIITLSPIIIMLSFANIINTSALSYQSDAEIKFTFNPTLSINISSTNLAIDNLTPGTTSDSNIINISVATNAAYGYTLSAIMNGNSSNLTHADDTNTFSSIATNSSLSSLATDNTWGYSYKLSNNTNWNNYSGLSNETSKTLINTDNQLAKPIDFKIAAKASSTQASGTYTNTINFIAISKPIPKTIEDIAYMQTFGELVETDLQSVKDSMEEEHTYTLKDARDEQDYTIAKLKDGKIWMTKNLNLAGGTEITAELSDVSEEYTLPFSSDSWGDNANSDYVYNSGNAICASNSPCYSYYSYPSATVLSGINIANNSNAPYSICPKGWKLPTSVYGTTDNSDFYHLIISYGVEPSDIGNASSETAKNFYIQAGPETTPNFSLSGQYYSSIVNAGKEGPYWSSTRRQATTSYYMIFSRRSVSGWSAAGNAVGFAVRCLAK